MSFWLHDCLAVRRLDPLTRLTNTSWVAIVTPTDRPKSTRNRSVIELFCGFVCVVILPFRHFCWCRGFCQRTESDLFLFLIHASVPYSGLLPWYNICIVLHCLLLFLTKSIRYKAEIDKLMMRYPTHLFKFIYRSYIFKFHGLLIPSHIKQVVVEWW